MTDPAHDGETLRERALTTLTTARARTTLLTSCVEDPDLTAQHSPLMSPLVWDLAHIGNQEEQWLLRTVAGREAIRPEIDGIYDAFEHPRAERPSLPLLPPTEARHYASEVRGRVLDLLESTAFHGTRLTEAGFAFGMIAQHEQQHDETMLITHQLRKGPQALHAPDPEPAPLLTGPSEVLVPGGPFTMGTSTEPWALDNERPAHVREVPAFYIDTTPVTNAAYQAFIEDGGYDDDRWWTAEGWAHIRQHSIHAPCSGDGTASSGSGAASVSPRSCHPTSPCCTCAGTRPTPTPAGPGAGCRPRPSGRRPPATTPPGSARCATRGATPTPRRNTPTSGSGICARHRPEATRRANHRWAYGS